MSVLKHLRSSTTNKRPAASGFADGQLAINTASGTPALFFKDNASGVVKVGPAHVGSTAPNDAPAGSAGNSLGELWINNGTTIHGLNYYNGSSFINLTPSGTTSTPGLVELATNGETQAGSDAARAVTPAALQSKVSNSISTTSSTIIASATAVKTAYDLANAALARTGGTVTGEILIGPSGSISFEGSTDDSFETTLAVVNPTADRTITFPNITGTVITNADTGTVTSTMIADDTIVNADINAFASIALSKLATGALPSGITIASSNIVNDTIVNADVNTSAAIAGTKISPNFGSQNVATTGTSTAAAFIPTGSSVPTNGVYLPAANSVAISTNNTGRLFIDSTGQVGIGTTSPGVALHVDGDIRADGIYGETDTNTSIQFPGSDVITFNEGGSEAARIDSSGRLLVGTSIAIADASSISRNLQILGTSATTAGQFTARFSNDVNASALVLGKSRGTTIGTYTVVNSGDQLGRLAFDATDGTKFVNAALIAAEVDGAPGANDMPGRLVFSVTADGSATPTEAMRINNAGELLVGYTADNGAYKLQVNSQIFATSATIATSDGRYKENVATLDGCVDLVKALRPVSFDWKEQQNITRIDDDGNEVLVREGHNFPDGTQVGFIAQEVEEVLTDKPWLGSVIKQNVRPAVTDNDGNELAPEEEFLGIAEGNLVAVLTSALKDAIGRIESLEAEVATLKA